MIRIVGVTACAAGIAHTYIAKEKIIKAAEKAGDIIHIETQGTIGTEDKLTAEEIKDANIVLLAIDVKISGRERFHGKRVVEVPTDTAIKAPNKLIGQLQKIVDKDKARKKQA